MKNTLLTTFTIFIIILSLINPLSAQKRVKYSKVKNTVEVCQTMEAINNYLENTVSKEEYKQSGITTFGTYNCIGLIFDSQNRYIDLDDLFLNVYNYINKENIKFENIRYIIFATLSNDIFVGFGNAIAISGQDWMDNIDDFDSIQESAIYLTNKEVYGEDPDLQKIVKSFRNELLFIKNYGGKKTAKKIAKREKQCYKRIK